MAGRKRDGFYKRDGSPFWWTRDPVTKKRCTTGYRDLDAARKWRAARERIAADPAHAAAEAATLGEWCGRFVAWKEKGGASEATVDVARQKLGHWIRLFGANASLASFSEPSAFDRYTSTRRSEGASDHTISKEVAHMLAVLKLAKRGKCFSGDLSTLRPPDLHAGYKPRKRALNRQELAALLAEIEPDRGAMVAIGVALGVRLGEAQRLLPTDIDWTAGRVYIRGTKTATSRRYVPILSLFRPLLESAASYLPLRPWGKVWRDIQAACKRAGIPACSTNDFRRTHATLLAEAGVDADHTRRLLGHTTRTLVDRVYGQPSTEALAELVESKLLGAAPLIQDFGGSGARRGDSATPYPLPSLSPAEAPEEPATSTSPAASQPKGENGDCVAESSPRSTSDPSGSAGEPDASNSEPVTAGRDPLILSSDVTIEVFPNRKELETSIITGAPEPTRTAGLRFRKAIPACEQSLGIEWFRWHSASQNPAGSGGFGLDSRGSDTPGSQ